MPLLKAKKRRIQEYWQTTMKDHKKPLLGTAGLKYLVTSANHTPASKSRLRHTRVHGQCNKSTGCRPACGRQDPKCANTKSQRSQQSTSYDYTRSLVDATTSPVVLCIEQHMAQERTQSSPHPTSLQRFQSPWPKTLLVDASHRTRSQATPLPH